MLIRSLVERAVEVDASRTVVTMRPNVPLDADTQYLVQIYGVTDTAGNNNEFFQLFFATGDGIGDVTLPDLMPVVLIAPTNVVAIWSNLTIPVAWGVINQGTGPVSGGWYGRVWFSTDGALDGQSVDLGDFYFNQTVAAGDTYWQTNSVALPMSNSGNYTLFVQVDVYNSISESTKINNISTLVSGVLTLNAPDLAVNMTVDNAFDLYVSTNDSVSGTLVTSGGNWGTTYTGGAILTRGVVNYVHVRAVGEGVIEAFIGEFDLHNSGFEFGNGTQTLLTTPTNWLVSPTGFGSNYGTTFSDGFNGVGPWGFRTGISPDAQWLDFPSGSVAYFSAPITPVPVGPPQLLRPSAQSGGFVISFNAKVGKTYTVQYLNSLNAGAWSVLTNITAVSTHAVCYDSVAGSPQCFYRVLERP